MITRLNASNSFSRPLRQSHLSRVGCFLPLSFVQLKLQRVIFRTFITIVPRDPSTCDYNIFTHVNCPHIDRVSGEISVRAEFDAVRPDIVIVTAEVVRVSVLAHFWIAGLSKYLSGNVSMSVVAVAACAGE